VKGLYDANPADILSRQGLTGPSPSAVQSIASRTGGNPAVIAAMQARQQRQMVSPPAAPVQTSTTIADKATFRPSSSPSTNLAANRPVAKTKFPGQNFRTHEDDSESDDEIIVNKSKPDTDLDDDDDDNEDEDESESKPATTTAVQSRAVTPPKPKRKRGRPPKNKKNDTPPATTTTTSESKGSDPYDFDATEDNAGPSASSGPMRTLQSTMAEDKSKQWRLTPGPKSKEDEEDENSAAKREV